jgi:hypothetical protein
MTEQQMGNPMNRATRVLLMSGVAVAAGMAFSAPAMAATSTPSPAGHTTQVAPRHSWSEGHYRSFTRCAAEGRQGVWSGDWDHYRCVRTGRGFELIVSEDWNNWNNGNNWGNWGNGGNSNHPRPGNWNHPHPGGMNHPHPGGMNHPMPHPKPQPQPQPTI